MIWCKRCPRCNGDLVGQSDIYGEFVSCLQCGGILNEQQERVLLSPVAKASHHIEAISDIVPSDERLPSQGQKRRAA